MISKQSHPRHKPQNGRKTHPEKTPHRYPLRPAATGDRRPVPTIFLLVIVSIPKPSFSDKFDRKISRIKHTGMADPFSEPDDTNCSSYQEEWIRIQESLKMKLVLKDDFTWTISSLSPSSVENSEVENLKYVGGADVSFLKEDSSVACAALVVLDVESLDVVREEFDIVRLDVPYIPGFLAFREASELTIFFHYLLLS